MGVVHHDGERRRDVVCIAFFGGGGVDGDYDGRNFGDERYQRCLDGFSVDVGFDLCTCLDLSEQVDVCQRFVDEQQRMKTGCSLSPGTPSSLLLLYTS